MNKHLLVDGNNLLMRAIYAARNSSMSSHGIATGPLHIFINTLAKHIREEKPSHVAVAWDGGRSAYRTKIDSEYKSARKSGPIQDLKETSFPLVKEFCSLADIYHVQWGDTEADDLIAAWWRNLTPDDSSSIVILSSDKDFLQLMGPNPHGVQTEQVRLSSADTPTDRWTEARVLTDMGCEPAQLPKVMALMGDVSDNVRGLHGIGPKKAIKLLSGHNWSLADTVELAVQEEDREHIANNFLLVDLREGNGFAGWEWELLGAPPMWRPTRHGDVFWEPLITFCDRYDLRQIKDRLIMSTLWDEGRVQPGRPLR